MSNSIISRGGVFALGNFDGVHRGHQAVVKTAIEMAGRLVAPSCVLTLEPHPRSLFSPGIPPFRLTPETTKTRLLKKLGVDHVVVQPFTQAFSQLTGQEFVKNILIDKYGAQHIVAGSDFVFGHQRSGSMKSLRSWLGPHGVGVTEITSFRDSKGEVMSSSRTREALKKADLAIVEHILGRPWSITGIVQHGDKRGRELSVPTANMDLGQHLRPLYGVYAVQAGRVGMPLNRQGVANIGIRPTIKGEAELLEFHLFDFYDDIYGQEWEIELTDFIRPEQAFDNLEMLRQQILLDIEAAKTRLIARC